MNQDKQNKYYQFLCSKMPIVQESGLVITREEIEAINTGIKKLKPHEMDAIIWALKGGRRALFESFGLGKTCQQLALAKIITDRGKGKALIVCPLGVKQEFSLDAANFYNLKLDYVRNDKEVSESDKNILITNYERVRDGNINPHQFIATSLDEASVLRSYGSKTYQTFLNLFHGVKYKFVCTATPSPNRYKELIHYAGYLEIMDTGQALTRFFQRDSTQANNLTLYPHKEEEFWLWVSSWALFITKPSDLGYDDTGYDLPEMKVHYHKIGVDHKTAGVENNGQSKMFRDAAFSLKDAAREKRESIDLRIEKMMEIVGNDPEDHFILWHNLESERHAIKKALPESTEVYGSLDIDIREDRIIEFSNGDLKYLATKPEISGSGCNFQRHCHKAIFLGINYQFHDFIQAVHRIYRFLQDKPVEIHVIYMESEDEILKVLLEKWQQHNELVETMIEIIKQYGLSIVNIQTKLSRTIGIKRREVKGQLFTAILNDCIPECMSMEENSIDLIHTSIPFSNHYEYTPSYNDFGHNEDNNKFFEQMDFVTPELLRMLKPGRVAAVHVKDRVLFGNATGTGMPTIDPFSDMTVFHFIRHGFQYMGRITVITDVVRENNQTYRLGWTEQCKDGTKMGVGCPEYILLFRKLPTDTSRAYADDPVIKSKKEYSRARWQIDAHAFWRSSGDRLLTRKEIESIPVEQLQAVYREWSRRTPYDYFEHVDLALALEEKKKLPASFMVVAPGSWHPDVWDDVNRMHTMNSNQSKKCLTMHICPLQFDIVERIINRFSNVGETLMDPFAGLMTVPYMAMKLGRCGIGIELNEESFKDGVQYLKDLEEMIMHPTLFDSLNEPMNRVS